MQVIEAASGVEVVAEGGVPLLRANRTGRGEEVALGLRSHGVGRWNQLGRRADLTCDRRRIFCMDTDSVGLSGPRCGRQHDRAEPLDR